MDILLLDLDDVLLETHAYHDSLIETLDRISISLGFDPLHLTDDELRGFEAAGVTAEWDSSAICVALLLDQADRCGGRVRLPYAPPHPANPAAIYPRPDLPAFINRLAKEPDTGDHPRQTAESILLARSDGRRPGSIAAMQEALQHGYDVTRSVSHRLIQELNLGSQRFAELYGIAPWLECEGYLESRDLPALSAGSRRRLLAWMASLEHAACVFTNRPCVRPDGQPTAPELEFGLRAAALPDLPAIGMGPLAWLAERRQGTPTPSYSYLKPSAVHALAAMRRALGDPAEVAVESAAILSEDVHADEGWRRLDGARLIALDDAVKGVRSAAAAQRALERAGIRMDLRLIGITSHPAKAHALREAGARLYPDAESALASEVFDQRVPAG
jgi:hypothetical protein